MAPRGKKTQAEAAKAATAPAETSTPAGDLSADAAEDPIAQDVGQLVPAAEMVADNLTGGENPSSATPAEPATLDADLAAEASSDAARQVLDAIHAQAEETREPVVLGVDMAARERRWFMVADPVSLDGMDFEIGDDVEVNEAIHAELRKAGVILQPWDCGVAI